jgi:hypothetical protein
MANRTMSNVPGGETAATAEKKPYATPILKRLGSVRELTLSGGATLPEGNMHMKAPGM